MTVTTDEDGSYIVNLDFLSGAIPDFDCDGVVDVPLAVLEWSGTLQVTSGSLFASADFEVKAPSEE